MREYIQLTSKPLVFPVYFLAVLLFVSCTKPTEFTVSEFEIDLKGQRVDNGVTYQLELDRAIKDGLMYPEGIETSDTLIRFSFKIDDLDPGEKVAYKVFYKNVTYSNNSDKDFYGGWGTTDESFKIAEANSSGLVFAKDGFRIQGNPRNEQKYFGSERKNRNPSPNEITDVVNNIKGSEEWSAMVKEKAVTNGLSFEDQIKKDAVWVLRTKVYEGESNNRWKRNPRMGEYRFALVVMPESVYEGLTEAEKDITQRSENGLFVDPFLAFKEKSLVDMTEFEESLFLNLKLAPEKGVYVDRLSSESVEWDTTYFNSLCDVNDDLFDQSHWTQFFHGVNKAFYLKNIPVSADVVNGYSVEEFNSNRLKYPISNRDSTHFNITAEPCRTVYVEGDSCIVLTNPPFVKEPVGIKSRIGMSYGTYTLKVAFPDMLNDDYIWNGITNAFWMIFESDAEWNERSPRESGYLKKTQSMDGPEERFETSIYSEIDIEIVKAAEHWPSNSKWYLEAKGLDEPAKNKDVIVSFTNWDMSYKDGEEFILGVMDIPTPHGTFTFNRWSELYNAVICKQGFDHDDMFKRPHYYFQIDWHPDRITWRMGPSRDSLSVFGYMDKSFTGIPDNQMVSVVTQEWHAAEWWPSAPWSQNDIPYPAEPLVGRVMELTVE